VTTFFLLDPEAVAAACAFWGLLDLSFAMAIEGLLRSDDLSNR
jgi:hypothetical protein